MRKRLLTLLLVLCMALMLPTAAMAALTEMPVAVWSDTWSLLPAAKTYEGHLADVNDAWCADAIKTVYEAGLMEGKTADRFDIASSLTNAQIVVISARLHSLLRGGDGTFPAPAGGEAWYRPALNYLLTQENPAYLVERLARQDDDTMANEPCSRLNFVHVIDSVLIEESHPREVLNPTVLPPDTRDEAVIRFYQAGILTGSDLYGTFDESSLLTRGAAAAILARYVDPLQREQFELVPFDLCRDVLGVEPDTILLTIDGTPVPAELFAEQLCVSLHQWQGNETNALTDAVKFWCHYQGAFRVLAAEKGISLSAEKQEEVLQTAQAEAGYLGLPAAYWQFRNEGSALNLALRDYYISLDDAQGFNGKWGESTYHKDLEARAETMIQSAIPMETLTNMDLSAVYSRLENSPFINWRF